MSVWIYSMARKAKARRMKKYDWMHTKLSFQESINVPDDGTHADSMYIDIAQCLSLMNRKLVRQGQMFRVKGLRVWHDGTDTFRVKAATIPTNWVARNAWVKGKALWDKMNAMALEEGDIGMLPKYHDYKVYMNANHKADSNIIPCDADDQQVSTTDAEWVYSTYSDSGSTSDNYDVKMLGQHEGSTSDYTCVGLIEAYRQSRIRPSTDEPLWPSDALDSPWFKLFGDDDQTGDVLTDLRDDNDAPPYPAAFYIGDGGGGTGFVDDGGFGVGTVSAGKAGAANNIATFPSFDCPLGLLRIEIDDDANTAAVNFHISFDVDIIGPMESI